MKKFSKLFWLLVALIVGIVIYLIVDYYNHKPVKDMTDLTYAVELVGKEKSAVKQTLGEDSRLFEASEMTGMLTSQYIADKSYKVEHSGYADVRLEYPTDKDEEILGCIYYYVTYDDYDNMQEVWEWVYTQWYALEKHFGRVADYNNGREMQPLLTYEDTIPSTKWIAGWKQGEADDAPITCIKVIVAADKLLRIELYTETDVTEITD